jgi:hypothetical protein
VIATAAIASDCFSFPVITPTSLFAANPIARGNAAGNITAVSSTPMPSTTRSAGTASKNGAAEISIIPANTGSPTPNLSSEIGNVSAGETDTALCAKCHDLNQVLNNSSFSEHARHVRQDGFSCSVCHTGHGLGAQSGNISGERLVNFDVKVVAPNGPLPISYNRATNSCSLVCHNQAHQSSVTLGTGKGHLVR